MISLRYHVVSIAAVFLALAVGVVLGSTAVGGRLLSGLAGDRESLGKQVADLEEQRNALDARLAAADRFATALGPSAVRGLLDKRTVVVISTVDASPTDRDAVVGLVRAAGGTVTGEMQLTDTFSDPSKADQLRQLVARLLPAGVRLPTASDPGTLAGGLIGPLVLLNKDNNQPQAKPEEAAAALRALADGGFVKVGGDLPPAQLAVVLSGGRVGGDAAGDRAATIARFATQVDRSGAGAVLAGRAGSADGVGPVGVVRADTAASSVLSTIDNVDTAAGRVVTVLALRQELEGRSGRYGTAGNAQAPAPEPAN
ncbi:Copper transport outer membrane protein, MctB [Streptoalloteichus tenebrarius]|uniref:Copper transport outer membrane protein, MctB n=1 Tax=Streptoalloteichus tenebrarius (strain ATCC 17920 / DSM 40477 / JCM 4838 / CBS 697.72 / NBRC 16177 / NCIMB 11028 / NRRL B-12390 / A12253. 1 / ISP 5477) TaxID=1933 RepID=A0ABT1I0J3_STRSD|nr:copper transporter [Streptoalloteichus tenebrarius]MCP2261279.1 Copper transport outer membrane protein, MctB [Streptoalloteichus tenebrarius]BFF03676.1 copper transporter [Streptoalloteichus tenebrarius]